MGEHDNTYYQYVLKECELRYPNIVENAVTWYPSYEDEIIFELEDGSKWAIDIYGGGTRKVVNVYNEDGSIDDELWRMEFGRRLKREMFLKGMTQLDLAEKTGINKDIISGYANGRNLPSVQRIAVIARALDCSTSDLIDF